jgi:2-oxoglutarate dehydrogenase E1 component
MSAQQANFLSGPNAPFIEELYAKYLERPETVDPSWRRFFEELKDEATIALSDIRGASWSPRARSVEIGADLAEEGGEATAVRKARPRDLKRAAQDSLRAMMLIRAYRVRGHLEASLDPLQLKPRERHADLDPRTCSRRGGHGPGDRIDNIMGFDHATLRQLVHVLRETYCGSIGVEYMHIQDPDQRKWLQMRIEGSRNQREFTQRGKTAILERLTASEMFEKFLDKKYTGTKRFGLDGANP